jgi:hypothetical protein
MSLFDGTSHRQRYRPTRVAGSVGLASEAAAEAAPADARVLLSPASEIRCFRGIATAWREERNTPIAALKAHRRVAVARVDDLAT